MPKEELDITIKATDQASAVFQKAGTAAQQAGTKAQAAGKQISSSLSGADLASAGRALLNFAETGVKALGSLVTASSNVVEAQNFAAQIFGESQPKIDAFAKSAATAVGMSKTMAEQSSASFGIFGRAIGIAGDDLVGFSTNLVGLAADMASVKNTTPERAITALGAAFRGQYRPIKDFGVILNDQVLKEAALALNIYDGTGKLDQRQKTLAINYELFKQLSFAQGDFARTSDQMANQQRIFNAELENLKANLGDSLRPMFVDLLEGANKLIGIFEKIPTPIRDFVMQGAALGVALAGIGGGMLFVGGKVIMAVEQFRKFSTGLAEMAAGGSKFASVLGKMGTAASLAAGAFVVLKGAEAIAESFTHSSEKIAGALGDIKIAAGKSDPEALIQGFQKLAAAQAGAANGFLGIAGIWEKRGREFHITAQGFGIDIENVDRAFDKLLKQDPNQAANLLTAIELQSQGMDKTTQAYKDAQDMIDRYTPKVQKAVQVQQAAGDTSLIAAENLKKYGDGTIKATSGNEDLTASGEDTTKMLEGLSQNLETAEGKFASIDDRTSAFQKTLQSRTGVSGFIQSTVEVQNAMSDLIDGFKDGDGNIQGWNLALDTATQKGRDNYGAVEDVAKAIQDDLIRVYHDSGGSLDAVTLATKKHTDELKWEMAQAGVSKEQIDKYVTALNLTPDDVQTAIKLNDQDVAMQKLQLLKLEMDKIPPDIATQIIAEVDQGDYIAAYDTAKGYITGQGSIPTKVVAQEDQSSMVATWNDINDYFKRKSVKATIITSTAPVASSASSSGSGKAAKPNSANDQAMSSMGLMSIGGELVSLPQPVTAGVAAPMATGHVFNITVNMPPGTNETRVVDLLRKYARTNGTVVLPRSRTLR